MSQGVDDGGHEPGLAAEVVAHGVAVLAGLARDGVDGETGVAVAREHRARAAATM